ncbi:hypothetical protein E4U42_001470 [Claviceps africana]|uniref:Uncharacterized protein n=1 Tax=Claviceps africana TaxID=83212 RepID=A0A8K0NI15_9HYPO|nr:hypothetical protein E4U42_001470 [Claviceps africana]
MPPNHLPQAFLRKGLQRKPIAVTSAMNRPRNRQPRHGSKDNNGHARTPARPRPSPATPQQASGTVPSLLQVVPGASVFIVLKRDQPTSRETAGVVAELLTRGNHPRGIKVRLRDGQVGRVQRMGNESTARTGAAGIHDGASRPARFSHRYTDVRNDVDFPSEPPSRSLGDFFPPSPGGDTPVDGDAGRFVSSASAAVSCPMCDSFEGDEMAVTRHIEREHLT